MVMPRVLITARSFARVATARAMLEEAGCELFWNPQDRPLTAEELVTLIPGMDALIAGMDQVTAAVIAAAAPTLKIIARHGVGYNNIDVAAARQHRIAVTITPGANSIAVAELVLGLMLAVARRIPQMDRTVRAGSWQRVTGVELAGKTLGLVGTGRIGGEVAKRAAAFAMNIIAYDVQPRRELTVRYGVRYLPLPEVLSGGDMVSLHIPATTATFGIINKNTLGLMKKSAVLINTARGELVVEDDLVAALESGIIAGAGLDTFAHEPVQNPRLLALPNVVLTPHAGAQTREAVNNMAIMAAQEVVRVLSGRPPLHPVFTKA